MADTIVQYTHFAGGASLEMHLHPREGGAKVNADVALSQPDAVNDPLLYQLIVDENVSGWHRGIIYPSGGGSPYAIGDVYLKNDTQKYQLGTRATPPVVVDFLSDAAKAAFDGQQLAFGGPVWDADLEAFDKPIVKGNDYFNAGLKLRITVADFPGRDLLTAASITLHAKKTEAGNTVEFNWTGTPEANGDDVDLVFAPTAAQTDQEPGCYAIEVIAVWSSPTETHSPVKPQGSQMEIIAL